MHAVLGAIAVFTSAGFIKWVGRLLLVGMGFGLMSSVGLEVFLVQLEDYLRTTVQGLPETMLKFLGIMNVDLYINWCFLGFSVRLSIIGLYRLVPNGLGTST